MLKLYFCPGTRAIRPMWVLEELGVSYEKVLVNLKEGEHKKEAYLKLNPLGVVPTLQDGDLTIFESIAICLYLSDKFLNKDLAPAFNSPERGLYYQWMTFVSASLEPAIFGLYSSKEAGEEAQAKALDKLNSLAAIVSNALEGNDYLVGNKLTTADLMVGSSLGWVQMSGNIEFDETIQKYLGRLMSRPTFQKVMPH